MRGPIALSKTKLLSFAQCRKRVWLETYSPELEESSGELTARIVAGERVGAIARELYGRGGGHTVSFDRGLRAAIEQTRALVAAGGSDPIFEATFDHDGVSVRIDVLDRRGAAPRIIEVKSSTRVKEHHLDDCAVQAYVLTQTGLAPRGVAVATIDSAFVYGGDGRYEGFLAETDVTDLVRERTGAIGERVVAARATLASLDEPDVAVGPHCQSPHACQFHAHCAPRASAAPPPSSARGRVGRELTALVRALPYPRYYLDFETVATAVPFFAGTRPYEPLAFQWSCHVETAPGRIEHREFLDVTGAAPMRGAAESLVAQLGSAGPILVYTHYERRVIGELAARFPDLADALGALVERLVDLYPPTRQHYEHAALGGSWSLKAVLPTVAADLDYARLEVRDGLAAQAAYLEAIDPVTSAGRRASLRQALLDYCRQDTLALVRLVEFFARAA